MAKNFAQALNIPFDYCLAAISELQESALSKLKSRNEYAQCGLATLKVRVPAQLGGTQLVTVNVKLSDSGHVLQESVSKELDVTPSK